MYTFIRQEGLLFLMILVLDMGAAALWLVGDKEDLRFMVLRHGKRRFKKHRGQKWWSYRIWAVSSFLKAVLFYVAVVVFVLNS